jgi:hypothetical protein
MTTRSLVRASLLTVIVVLVSCSDATVPTAPLSVPSAGVAPTPEPAQPLPAPTPPAIISVDVTGARVFRFVSPLPQLPVSWYTGGSRYVLYPDGAFVLEYPHVVYRGRYTEDGGRITFECRRSPCLCVLDGRRARPSRPAGDSQSADAPGDDWRAHVARHGRRDLPCSSPTGEGQGRFGAFVVL